MDVPVGREHLHPAADAVAQVLAGVGMRHRLHHPVEPAPLQEVGPEGVEEPGPGAEDEVDGGPRDPGHPRDLVDVDRLRRGLAQPVLDGVEDAAPGRLRRIGAEMRLVLGRL